MLATPRLILVVDDDDNVRETLVDALAFEGFTVESARNGEEGLAWLQDHGEMRCLVVLDLMMPVMNGRVFLDQKANDPALAPVPVIVLTAGGDCRELNAAGGLVRCFPKTVTLPDLVTAIQACA
jgi:CheY-like chemotaxis protein